MSVKSDRVKTSYADLSDEERNEVKRFINDYDSSTYSGKLELKTRVNESLSKSLGPTFGNRCSQCGK